MTAANEETSPSTLEECEAAGRSREPKSRRVGLNKCVEHFLKLSMKPPEGIDKKAQYKQRECYAEMRGFYKAQEALREVIALAGTDAIGHLADVRSEDQERPQMIGNLRVWFG